MVFLSLPTFRNRLSICPIQIEGVEMETTLLPRMVWSPPEEFLLVLQMKRCELLPNLGNNLTSRTNSSLLSCKIILLFHSPYNLLPASVSSSRFTTSLKSVRVPLFIAIKVSSEHSPGSEYLGIRRLVHTHYRCQTGIAFPYFSMLLKIKSIGCG